MTSRREFLARAAAIAAATAWPAHVWGLPRGEAQTVLGPLDASRLGFTLPHEHIADGPYHASKWPEHGRAGFVTSAVEKLKPVRAAGVSTIVDLTTYDVWRDIRFLEEVSAA